MLAARKTFRFVRPRAAVKLSGATALTSRHAAFKLTARVALGRPRMVGRLLAVWSRFRRGVASGIRAVRGHVGRCGSVLALATLATSPAGTAAQDLTGPWSLVVRGTLSGSSYDSSPAGYKLYSGVAIEVGVRRAVAEVFALELAVRTESREINGPPNGTDALGGLEVVTLTPTFLWRPRGGSDVAFQPYLGVGGALGAVWEKSGALDSADLSPQIDPTIQAGLDFELSRRVALNLDARWQTLRWTIDDYLVPSPRVKVDPLVLGVGARVAF